MNKLILIGASRGIGRKFIETYYSNYSEVLAIGSSKKIHELKKLSNNIFTMKIDISKINLLESKFKKWIAKKIWHKSQKIGIVCFAADLGKPGGINSFDYLNWKKILDCNLLSHLLIISLLKKKIKKEDLIRIVMFGGGGAAYSYPDFFSYSLSKVAIIRAVENIGKEFRIEKLNASIIALAPGAVDTDMLKKVLKNKGFIKTKTNIIEPVNLINNFLLDKINSRLLNGRFIHVRDKLNKISKNITDMFMLRRIQ
jgi:short-subunit dehydrogenase